MEPTEAEVKASIRGLIVEELLRNPNIIPFYDGNKVRYINKLNARASHIAAAIKLQKDIMAMIESGGAMTPAEAVAVLEASDDRARDPGGVV